MGHDLLNFLVSGLMPMMETPVKMSFGFHHLLTGVSFVRANSIDMVLQCMHNSFKRYTPAV